jgi:hypothetical protein
VELADDFLDHPDRERSVFLVEAYDNANFRNDVAATIWAILRVYFPNLKPWHDSDRSELYLGDDNEYRAGREATLALIP